MRFGAGRAGRSGLAILIVNNLSELVRLVKGPVYRLYREMGLAVRSKYRRKIASRGREVVPISASAANDRWSMDFVTDRFESGRYFRILTLVDSHTRECLALEPDARRPSLPEIPYVQVG